VISMIKLRHLFPTLFLATSFTILAGGVAIADAPDAASAGAPGGSHWHRGHGGRWDLTGMGLVLRKLDLNSTQKAAIKAIFAGQKTQFEALRQSVQANRLALASTPPTAAGYAALIATAQKNAATRITLASTIWTDIYTNVLTTAQQGEIPGIVAAAQAERQAKIEAWKAEHPSSP
jgi:Spy/CpxP family protein refolding chaperone